MPNKPDGWVQCEVFSTKRKIDVAKAPWGGVPSGPLCATCGNSTPKGPATSGPLFATCGVFTATCVSPTGVISATCGVMLARCGDINARCAATYAGSLATYAAIYVLTPVLCTLPMLIVFHLNVIGPATRPPAYRPVGPGPLAP